MVGRYIVIPGNASCLHQCRVACEEVAVLVAKRGKNNRRMIPQLRRVSLATPTLFFFCSFATTSTSTPPALEPPPGNEAALHHLDTLPPTTPPSWVAQNPAQQKPSRTSLKWSASNAYAGGANPVKNNAETRTVSSNTLSPNPIIATCKS